MGWKAREGVVRVSDYADLVVGKADERIFTGYTACLTTMVPFILNGLPKGERIEFVFEQQKQYSHAVDFVMSVYTNPQLVPQRNYFTSDGLPKIAKWGFVPKGTTIMTDPADYLAFALRELHTDQRSQKSQWCRPIFAGNSAYGRTLSRDRVRRIVRRAQWLGTQQALS